MSISSTLQIDIALARRLRRAARTIDRHDGSPTFQSATLLAFPGASDARIPAPTRQVGVIDRATYGRAIRNRATARGLAVSAVLVFGATGFNAPGVAAQTSPTMMTPPVTTAGTWETTTNSLRPRNVSAIHRLPTEGDVRRTLAVELTPPPQTTRPGQRTDTQVNQVPRIPNSQS